MARRDWQTHVAIRSFTMQISVQGKVVVYECYAISCNHAIGYQCYATRYTCTNFTKLDYSLLISFAMPMYMLIINYWFSLNVSGFPPRAEMTRSKLHVVQCNDEYMTEEHDNTMHEVMKMPNHLIFNLYLVMVKKT
jgi:hypothetical protein